MFKKLNLKKDNLNVSSQFDYYHFASFHTLQDDIIIEFKQCDHEGITKQIRLVMNIISAKLTNMILKDAIDDFESDGRLIRPFQTDTFDSMNKEKQPLDLSLNYTNHLSVSVNPIAMILEYYFDGPSNEIFHPNIIVKPTLAKHVFLSIEAIIEQYEQQHGKIDLDQYLQ